jgi:hypothetical protein
MVTSQLANVYSAHKYYHQIPITIGEKTNDYRHAPPALPFRQVGTGGAFVDGHTQSILKPATDSCACSKLTAHAIPAFIVTAVSQCQCVSHTPNLTTAFSECQYVLHGIY